MLANLEIYTRWVGQRSAARPSSLASQLARRWFAQMALNLALAAAIFGVAAFIAEYPKTASNGYVIFNGERPEKISDRVTAIPWRMM